MTTVVFDYKNNQISCDSKTTQGGNILSLDIDKFNSINNGELWFFSGCSGNIEDVEKLKHGDKVPEHVEFFELLVIKKQKVYLGMAVNGYIIFTHIKYNITIGSGQDFAMAFLHIGKSARESVELTSRLDTSTGGKVRVFCTLTGTEVISVKFT